MIKSGIQNLNSLNIQPSGLNREKPVSQRSKCENKVSFGNILQDKIRSTEEVKFSAHAIERLKLRNINLTNDDISRINKAVTRADTKGSRDSLVLMDGLAFIVNIPNKTVITAMSGKMMKENVITNIDSTVIA